MVFEHRPAPDLDTLPLLSEKKKVGTVSQADYPARFIAVCERVPPPKKQFDGAKRLYPKEPVRRCGEWAEETVEALTQAGVLKLVDT